MPTEIELQSELETVQNDLVQVDKAIARLTSKRDNLLARKKTIKQLLQENASEKLANQNWERTDHPWSSKVENVLKSVFKLNSFRPYQLSTINAVFSGNDCILLMPTGGGKSLCYQLPAMVLKGMTLVVSPLVSLMEDQLMAMDALHVPAALLNASSTREHVNHVHKEMTDKNPSLKLLYVTPEKLAKSKRFMAKLEKMYQMGMFSLLAIDEVHCCSQWGHDFRTDYKFLGIMKRQFPKVPILGLTATATASVISDVQNILNLSGCLVLKASFNRPNLKYEVVCKSSSQKDNVQELENMLKNRFNSVSGIIYCFSIKDSEEIASELRRTGIKARAYHAQLDAKGRSSVHKSWANNSVQVIVATVAFGMGIDKPDVRFVIHYSMPKSMENFYQESGRAGRDDNPASCILFYRFPDIFRQSTMIFTEQKGLEHLYAMVAYCLDLSRCRRSIIAEHFGERWESSDCNRMCDHCDHFSPYTEKSKDIAKEYKALRIILEQATLIDERMTAQKVMDAWQGKGPPKLRPSGVTPTKLSRETCERIVALLLLESYLIEEFHFTPYSTISYINVGPRHLNSETLFVPMPILRAKCLSEKVASSTSETKDSKPSSISASQPSTSKLSSQNVSPKTSKSSSSSNGAHGTPLKKSPTKLCVVNEEKSHFHQSKKQTSSESNKQLKKDSLLTVKKQKITEEEVSDNDSVNELKFDCYELNKKMENTNSCSNKSHERKKTKKYSVPVLTISDSD